MIRVGIIGGAGYTAGELLRILKGHPDVDVAWVQSGSHAGEPLHRAHPDLIGEYELAFVGSYQGDDGIDALFLCSGHGASRAFLEAHRVRDDVAVIDLSSDFRLERDAALGDRRFIYGMPELNRDAISRARSIANPGCFATAIQLALLPLAVHGLLTKEVHVNAVTGSTGAGYAPTETTHFSWREGNVSIYKPFEHRHGAEIEESLARLQKGSLSSIRFLPVRGSFTRGIFATAYMQTDLEESAAREMFRAFYRDHPLTLMLDERPDLKSVVNTSRCLLHVERCGDLLLVTSVIDNLLKGASGQAVQNLNLMFALDETAGLNLKPSAY